VPSERRPAPLPLVVQCSAGVYERKYRSGRCGNFRAETSERKLPGGNFRAETSKLRRGLRAQVPKWSSAYGAVSRGPAPELDPPSTLRRLRRPSALAVARRRRGSRMVPRRRRKGGSRAGCKLPLPMGAIAIRDRPGSAGWICTSSSR
jgi:hypothetical protein